MKSASIDVTQLRDIRAVLETTSRAPNDLLANMEKRISIAHEKVRNAVTEYYPQIVMPKDIYARCSKYSSMEAAVNEINSALWPVIGFLDTLVNPIDGIFHLVEADYYEAKNLIKSLELSLLDNEIFYRIHISKVDRDHHVAVVLGPSQELFRKIEIHFSSTKDYVKWLEKIVEQYSSMLSTLRLKQKIREQDIWANNLNSGLPKMDSPSQEKGLVWGDRRDQIREDTDIDVDSILNGSAG